jgi:uncharacterized membrane protein
MFKFLKIFLILLFFNFNFIFSYYGDFEIEVFENGEVKVLGDTNFNELIYIQKSQKFTSKKKEYWVFNLTTNEIFEKYSYELKFPKNTEINYIKSVKNFKIKTTDKNLIIVGNSQRGFFNLIIQYKLNSKVESFSFSFYSILAIIIFVIFMSFRFFSIYLKLNFARKNPTKKSKEKNEIGINKKEFDYSHFPIRQKDMIDILKKQKGNKIKQKEFEKLMLIPKSSISRNIKSLKKRGVLRCERFGTTKWVFLK